MWGRFGGDELGDVSWDFSDDGGGANAPRNDWGFLLVEFFRPEIGIVGGRMELEMDEGIGCGGARGPNPRCKTQQKK